LAEERDQATGPRLRRRARIEGWGREATPFKEEWVTDERRLLRLRALTTRLRKIPGAVVLLEYVRRHCSRRGAPIVVPDFDGTLRLELRLDEHMESQIFWYGDYSREVLNVLARLLAPGMVVIDAGANIGEVSLFAAKRVRPGGRVISFEPVPGLAQRLRANVARNDLAAVEVVEMGLAEHEGSAEIFTSRECFRDGTSHAGLATLYAQPGRAKPIASIALTTLDRFVHERGLDRVDVLKVDVEGAELPLLRGSAETLGLHRPWLLLEVQQETSRAAGYGHAEILTFLERYGYRFARLGRRGALQPLSVATLLPFQNVLAIPPGRSLSDAR
jgi:FkbM family methyltransferase